jgi:hypothetical protein
VKSVDNLPRPFWIVLLLSIVIAASSVQLLPAASLVKEDQFLTYIPLVSKYSAPKPQVNAPYMTEMKYATSAVFWFGRVTSEENYVDVRVGYDQDRLWVHLEIFDRRLWYDPTPSPGEFSQWDAVSLYLDASGSSVGAPSERAYRFDGMLNWWEPRAGFQQAYHWNGQAWILTELPFEVLSGWKGNAPNDTIDDRGWILVYHIPFTSLGLPGAPNQGAYWRMAIALHDRDSSQASALPDKFWPTGLNSAQLDSWGVLHFGLPVYQPPAGKIPAGQTVIRHKLNGQIVNDAMVGGGFNCGEGLEYWTVWGQANYAGSTQVNVQNEFDVSDWPCFSKYYLTFPLDAIPSGKVILSATLTLYQIGNAGGGNWGPPGETVIQVLTTQELWDENTITWNNAPGALENIIMARVDPTNVAGVPRQWDVSYAVYQAYQSRGKLQLVLYSADGDYNTGRYFNSSDLNDYEAVQRPTLTVIWGEP